MSLADSTAAALEVTAGELRRPFEDAASLTEGLTRIAAGLEDVLAAPAAVRGARAAEPAPSGDSFASARGGSVEWLDDDELADRLHGLLRRQAQRRGIELS